MKCRELFEVEFERVATRAIVLLFLPLVGEIRVVVGFLFCEMKLIFNQVCFFLGRGV